MLPLIDEPSPPATNSPPPSSACFPRLPRPPHLWGVSMTVLHVRPPHKHATHITPPPPLPQINPPPRPGATGSGVNHVRGCHRNPQPQTLTALHLRGCGNPHKQSTPPRRPPHAPSVTPPSPPSLSPRTTDGVVEKQPHCRGRTRGGPATRAPGGRQRAICRSEAGAMTSILYPLR